MHRAARGLTLIELTLALGLLATLVLLTLPSVTSVLARHRLKAAAEVIAHDLADLRFEAAQRGTSVHLRFERSENWCYALARSSPCGCGTTQVCQIRTVRGADFPGVRLVDATDAQFLPVGGIVETIGGALLQGADGTQLRVALTRLGRPKVCAPGGAVSGYAAC